MIGSAFPPSYGLSINDQAIMEAQTGESITLLIEGYINAQYGVPDILRSYSKHMKLRIYSTYDAPVALGVYFLDDDQIIEDIIAQLEDHGGYRYVLYERDGSVIAQN